MNASRKIALGLLALCVIALLVGVISTVTSSKAQETQLESKSSVTSLLTKKDHLLLIELNGPIFMDAPQEQAGILHSDTNAVSARKALDKAAEDDKVKGVLLRINSPGGTVAMSQELNKAVQRVRSKKPVVASLGDMAASGGYYTACAADKIVANQGTLTASIGVIISTLNMKELFQDKLGIKPITIKSGKFKDLLAPYREQNAEEIALIQKLVDESYLDFLNAVIDGRTHYITDAKEKAARIAKIKAVADGRVVHGQQAVDAGLADEIGDIEHAYVLLDKMAKERSGLKGKDKLPLERVEDSFTLWDFLGMTAKAPAQMVSTMAKQPSYMDMVPLSLRYPNQPLWIVE